MIDFSADGIPALLKAASRWAPWTAKWNVRRAKYDKIPKSAHNVLHSLSTAQPQHWHAYQQALQAHLQQVVYHHANVQQHANPELEF